jgi:glycosyltransferase involved in cell wall biosynthesis
MLFSVIIPTYNRISLLQRTLASVRAQLFADYEIIVVDDGSTDATREWLASQSGAIRVLHRSNGGPGAARNRGVREARGDYIAFLDSDDLWFPWTLSAFARAIEEHGQPNILNGRYLEFSDDAELAAVRQEPHRTLWFQDYFASSKHPFSVGSGTCVLRREAAAATTFSEDRLNAEDHDLILRMGTLSGFVQIMSPITMGWRRHSASETGNFASSVSGSLRLVSRERQGAYAGGDRRSQERHRILARHTRATAIACVRHGEFKKGWSLYRSSAAWNLRIGHWKFVLAFPVLAAVACMTHIATRLPGFAGMSAAARARKMAKP